MQAPDQPRQYLAAACLGAGAVTLIALAAWAHQVEPFWLVVALAANVVGTGGALIRPSRLRAASAAALWLALGIAGGVQQRLHQVTHAWPAVRQNVETRRAEALRALLDDLVDQGQRAVAAAGAVADGSISAGSFRALDELRRSTSSSALAVYDTAGSPVVWAGEHRGEIPDSVRLGQREFFFADGPIFRYLYFTRELADGSVAVAAVLLSTAPELASLSASVASGFAGREGLTPRFTSPERAQGPVVWDWVTDRPILSVSFDTLTQDGWRERILLGSRVATFAALLLALSLLLAAWRRSGWPVAPAVAIATACAALYPWGALGWNPDLMSSARFVLPAPLPLSLGQLLIVLCGGGVVLALLSNSLAARFRLPPAAAMVGCGVLVPAVLAVLYQAVLGGTLGLRGSVILPLAFGGALALGLPCYVMLVAAGDHPGRRWHPAVLLAPLALALVLSMTLGLLWRPEAGDLLWLAPAWGVPFGLLALTVRRLRLPPGGRWLVSLGFASLAVLPSVYLLQTQIRLQVAEGEVRRMNAGADPFLDFLLRQFADRVLYFAAEGETDVNLLYHSWVASGLAKEGYAARITLWRDGMATADLPLTDAVVPPSVLSAAMEAARGAEEPVVRRYPNSEAVHYLLMITLPDDELVSVSVPPRHRLELGGALARVLRAGDYSRGRPEGIELLSVIPTPSLATDLQTGPRAAASPRVRWTRTQAGWRSEAELVAPAGSRHAHLLVRAPGPGMLMVRALLVLILLLAVAGLLWLLALLLREGPRLRRATRWRWLASFRGRLTLALFAFFLLPMLAFSAVAYRALSEEVVRAAAALARWSLEQVALQSARAPIDELGAAFRADLLLYEDGVLVDAASPELVALGLFQSWLPPSVYLGFRSGENLDALDEQRLAGASYLVAFRRVDGPRVLGVPIPLAAGEVGRRQRELTDVVLLMSLFGAVLSVVLALLVGRALSRPIEQLSRAAAAVGGGNLGVELPEARHDEFGVLFRSFNRMIARLRQTREALLRETRRTEAIVDQAGTGVLALEANGTIALVNPRARQILGENTEAGAALPQSSETALRVAAAVGRFWQSARSEHSEEIRSDGRTIRLRLRRLRSGTGLGGTVIVLEDITDELRSARVLAWGEMARQVAHEIKNPLTPIKLSVQHLRRAYLDGRHDYPQILDHNVEAVLAEIDRLGEIARGFARFGTPDAAEAPLHPVDVTRVISDTLALYRSGNAAVVFDSDLADDLPPVFARTGELKEVLVNLLENAREAVQGLGTITVSAHTAGQEVVEIRVADDGEGMPEDVLGRIFEPQFSTRTSGTGLGLAIVQRLVDSWDATVTASSGTGKGTAVSMLLRRAPAPAADE